MLPSLEAWLREVKKAEPVGLRKAELAAAWAEFREDFNTATLPDRYYDVERDDARARAAAAAAAAAGAGAAAGGVDMLADAEAFRREQAEAARRREAERMLLLRAAVSAPERVAAMERQAQLQAQAQYAHRSGDSKTASALLQKLKPEDARVAALSKGAR